MTQRCDDHLCQYSGETIIENHGHDLYHSAGDGESEIAWYTKRLFDNRHWRYIYAESVIAGKDLIEGTRIEGRVDGIRLFDQ